MVLHWVPLTSRKPRSPQDLNRPRPSHAIPGLIYHKFDVCFKLDPVRHSIPLPLSIVARPHEAGLIVPGELIALPLSGSIPQLPMFRSRFQKVAEILIGRRCGFGVESVTSSPHAKLIASSVARLVRRIDDRFAFSGFTKIRTDATFDFCNTMLPIVNEDRT